MCPGYRSGREEVQSTSRKNGEAVAFLGLVWCIKIAGFCLPGYMEVDYPGNMTS